MILRGAKNKNYSVIANAMLRDGRLSYRARGIAAYLLTQPDDWRISSEALASGAPEGRDAVRSAMKELEELGYLVRIRTQDGDGRWKTEVVLNEKASTDDGFSGTDDGKPGVGFPVVGFPGDNTKYYTPSTIHVEEKTLQTTPTAPSASVAKQGTNSVLQKKSKFSSSKQKKGEEGAKPPHTPVPPPPFPPYSELEVKLWNENVKYTVSMTIGDLQEKQSNDYAVTVSKSNAATSGLPRIMQNLLLNMVSRLLMNISQKQSLKVELTSTSIEELVGARLSPDDLAELQDIPYSALNFSMRCQETSPATLVGNAKLAVCATTMQVSLTLTGLFLEEKAVNMRQETSVSSAQTATSVGRSMPKTGGSNPLSPAEVAMRAYLDAIERHEGKAVINFGRERTGINALVKLGYTADQITKCIDIMKAEPFWTDKHLSAQSIGKDIGAKLNGHSPKNTEKTLNLNSLQRWLKNNYGVTDLETAEIISGKTQQELLDEQAIYA